MKLTTVAALVGAADTAGFAVTRRRALLANPGRASGTVAALALWAALAQSAARRARGPARALAVTAVAANAAMLAVHRRAAVRGPRIYTGTALALVALAGTVLGD